MFKLRFLLLLFVNIIFIDAIWSQVSINIDGLEPDSSAMLDVQSTEKGMLIPRMTSVQRTLINNPATGLLVFDMNTESFWFMGNSNWIELNDGNFSSIHDTDSDTNIQVEASPDEDTIRIAIDGVERLVMGGHMIEPMSTGGSVFFGEGAGENDNLSPNNNSFIGCRAGQNTTSGDENTALGYESLLENVIGVKNTAVGVKALKYNTGHQNTAVGVSALSSNHFGADNVGVGFAASVNNSGSFNTVIGAGANARDSSGSRNTIVGFEAGRGAHIFQRSGSVLLGFKAGYNETRDNRLYIDNSDTGSPLIWGDFARDSLRINGSFVVADGSNNLSVHGHQIEPLNNGKSVFIGEGAGTNDNLNENQNVAIGFKALNASETGRFNVAIGYQALMKDTTGANTAIGRRSLENNTSGVGNTALGLRSMLYNESGTANTSVGIDALRNNNSGDYNAAMGTGAMLNHVSGDDNIAVGAYAGQQIFNGERNTMLGYMAGSGGIPHNKSGGVFIGYNAGANELTDNKLYIENSNSNFPLIYGDFATDKIHINGALSIKDGTQNAGYVLVSDNDGEGSWQPGGKQIIDSDNDTYIDVETALDSDTISFVQNGTLRFRIGGPAWEPINSGQSTFIGEGAGANDDLTNNTNTFLGYISGQSNTTGFANVAIGAYSFTDNTSGIHNIAIGQGALLQNTIGSSNVAVGKDAQYLNTFGVNNVAIGENAGYTNGGGGNNITIGKNSDRYNTFGEENTIIGAEAGGGSSNSKSGNVFLGYQAGFNESTSDKLYIENSSSTSPLIYGDFANDFLRVNGSLSIVDGTQQDGLVLTSDAAGNASWQMVNPLSRIQDIDGDTYIEAEESVDDDTLRIYTEGIERIRISNQTIEPINTGKSLFLGKDAGVNDDLSDNENTYLGYRAGTSSVDGYWNVGVGTDALSSITNGYRNVAIGRNAGGSMTTASHNVAIGYQALDLEDAGAYNVVVGGFAASNMHDGVSNVIIGHGSGSLIDEGYNNVLIGLNAGSGGNFHSKQGCVMIGNSAGYYEETDDKLFIENTSSSTPLIWGDFANDLLRFHGNVSIGSTASAYALQVGNSGDGTEARGNAWNTFSDQRLKKDFSELPNAVEMLSKLNGYYYYWKNENVDSTRQVGVMAQEVEQVLPEIVSTDEEGILSVDYGKLSALLIEVNQVQQKSIELLEKRLNAFQVSNELLKEQNTTLEADVAMIKEMLFQNSRVVTSGQDKESIQKID